MKRAVLVLVLLLAGCDGDSRIGTVAPTPATPVQVGAAMSSNVKELTEELKNVRARERLLEGALADARTDAVQTKLWLGSGACFLAAPILVALGVWTTRRILIELGIGAAGLGGLCIFAAWLAPYAVAIGITIGALVLIAAGWMLWNRQRALAQVTAAVDAIKPRVSDYADTFRQHIDTGAERLIDHVRRTRKA